MAKKERIVLNREGDVDAIDQEMEEAMSRLDGANEKIATLLESIVVGNTADAGREFAEEPDEQDADAGGAAPEASEQDAPPPSR